MRTAGSARPSAPWSWSTGKVLTGFDLDRGLEVTVDHPSRRIRITLPPPSVQGVEITELKTYDEQRGLWNPFTPSDRDTIFALARRQLVATAGQVELARHAEESARRLLEAIVRADGYTTEVRFAGERPRGPADTAGRAGAIAEGPSMLAYVFWHWRRPDVPAASYEALQRRFHAALGAAPPPGLPGLALAGDRGRALGRRRRSRPTRTGTCSRDPRRSTR